jgi:hypothetical protein
MTISVNAEADVKLTAAGDTRRLPEDEGSGHL